MLQSIYDKLADVAEVLLFALGAMILMAAANTVL